MTSVLEEIKSMQGQGMSEDKIISSLRERGVPHKDILDALSRTKIKAAVEQPSDEPQESQTGTNYQGMSGNQVNSGGVQAPTPSELQVPKASEGGTSSSTQGMQKSIMSNDSSQAPNQMDSGSQQQRVPGPSGQQPTSTEMGEAGDYGSNQEYYEYPGYGGQEDYSGYDGMYSGYSGYGGSNLSSDVVSEISEQVVSEKISEIRKGVEKIIDFKTTMEAKVESLGERLQRIEKIIDTLQASVLRKTGDYMTNVEDIKKEMIETQKTFSKLLPEFKKEIEKDKKKSKSKSSKKK